MHFLIFSLVFCLTVQSSFQARFKKKGSESHDEAEMIKTIQNLAKEAGHPDSKSIGKSRKDVCYSKACLEAAIEIMEAIDFKADACDPEGFGPHACHRRLHRDPSLKYQSQFGNKSLPIWLTFVKNEQLSNELVETPVKKRDPQCLRNAKIAYKQCTNIENMAKQATKSLWKISESIGGGGWPVLTQQRPTSFNWVKFAGFLSKFSATTVLFEVSSFPTEDGLELTLDKGTAATNQEFDDIQESYTKLLKYIRKSWSDFDAGFELPNSFDVGIAKTMQTRKTIALYTNMFATQRIKTKMTIAELTDFTYNIDWLDFFETAFESTHVDITPDTVVHVNKPYIKILAAAMDTAGVWESSLLQFELFSMFRKETSIGPIPQRNCATSVQSVFGAALSKEFLKRNPSPEGAKEDIKLMMDNVVKSLKDDIRSSSVLSKGAIKKLVDKFDQVEAFLGYPVWLDDKARVEHYYEKMKPLEDRDDRYLHNIMEVWAWDEGIKREGLVPDHENLHYWPLNSFVVESNGANYFKPGNALRVPAAFSTPPIYSYGVPGFMNYGGLATVLAHELGHGMDTSGIFYNGKGHFNRASWLDAESIKVYEEWIEGIMRDFNGTKIHFHGPPSEKIHDTLLGTITINDDIADIIGLHVAFNAYKKYVKSLPGKVDMKLPGLEDVSGDKLFYVKYSNMWCEEMTEREAENVWASNHSPGYNRATVPLKRSKHFAKTFGCKNDNNYEL